MTDIHSKDGIDFKDYIGARWPSLVTTSTDEPKPEDEPTPAEPERKRPDISPLEATILLARRGNKKVLPMLRRTLAEHPELWKHFGDLALQSQEAWLQLIAGKDLLLSETLRLHLDAIRTELAGPKPSPLDPLLIDRVLATHVQVLYFEAMETTDPTAENMRVARYRMDRRDQAHRQFLSAVKMLAMVRNLVARTNTIQVQFLNPPMGQSAATPIVPMANGEQPPTYNGPTNRIKDLTNPPPAKPVNGANGKFNGMNGHARFNNPLEPATAE